VHEEGAQQDGQQSQRDQPGIETGEDREAADQLGQNDRPGEEVREADLGQEGGKARHREHGDFQIGVRDEHDAEGGT
jgi:hypothetical protein